MSEKTSPGEQLLIDTEQLDDLDVWVLAVGMVAIAGRRAAKQRRDDINKACMKFVMEMSGIVGTPSLPEKFQ